MPATKKIRPKPNLHVAECIRQFELPRQFPSMVTATKKPPLLPVAENTSLIQTKNVQNIISGLPFSSNMKFIPNKEINLSNNLQKLKLRSQDGRDLGEFNVEGVGSNSKVMKLTKTVNNQWITNASDGTITIPEIITLTENGNYRISESPVITDSNIMTNQLITGRNNLQGYDQNSFCVINPDVGYVKEKVTVLPSNLKSKQSFEAYKVITTMPTTQVNPTPQYMLIAPKQVQNISNMEISDSQANVFANADNNLRSVLVNNTQGQKRVMVLRAEDYPFLKNASPGQKITVNQNVQPVNSATKVNIVYKNSTNDAVFRKRQYSDDGSIDSNKYKKSCQESVLVNDNLMVNNVNKQLNGASQDMSNFVTVIQNNLKVNTDVTKSSRTSVTKDIVVETIDDDSNTEYLIDDDDCVDVSDEQECFNDLSSVLQTAFANNGANKDLSNDISILEKAVRSVQDQHLRNKALKALKDCVIGAKKRVPIRKPTNTKDIRDSQCQTHVFSLLEKGEFVEVTEESESISRIRQTQKIQRTNNICNGNALMLPVTCRTSEPSGFASDLDKMIQNMFGDRKEVIQVNNILNQGKMSSAQRVFQQLKTDFEAAKTFNKKGLLGIHVAVLNNNMQDVQRHTKVLKAMRKSIDICTEDGKTSLELAVECDCNRQIIKFLLEMGAQPLSDKPIHSSALIIASKNTPSLIPLLAEKISNNQELINAKDENGYAALHYAAEHGDIVGLTTLLKHGADVNLCEDRSGRTALFFAVENKHHKAAQVLLSSGANSNIPNFSRQTVLAFLDDIKSNSLRLALTKAASK